MTEVDNELPVEPVMTNEELMAAMAEQEAINPDLTPWLWLNEIAREPGNPTPGEMVAMLYEMAKETQDG